MLKIINSSKLKIIIQNECSSHREEKSNIVKNLLFYYYNLVNKQETVSADK